MIFRRKPATTNYLHGSRHSVPRATFFLPKTQDRCNVGARYFCSVSLQEAVSKQGRTKSVSFTSESLPLPHSLPVIQPVPPNLQYILLLAHSLLLPALISFSAVASGAPTCPKSVSGRQVVYESAKSARYKFAKKRGILLSSLLRFADTFGTCWCYLWLRSRLKYLRHATCFILNDLSVPTCVTCPMNDTLLLPPQFVFNEYYVAT